MHTSKSEFLPARLAGVASRLVGALLMVLVVVGPAFAQEAPAGGRSGGILNVLLLGCIAYFLVRSFRRRGKGDDTRPGRWSRTERDETDDAAQPRTMDRHEAARQTWDMLRSDQEDNPAPSTPTGPTAAPAGFDEAEFIEGAKVFFSRFQQAADAQDFQAIRDFISDEVFADAMANAGQGRTEIMLLNARLMEMNSENGRTTASVFYDAQLRVGDQGERTEHLRAVWEFSRDDSVENGLWVLEKINSVDQ